MTSSPPLGSTMLCLARHNDIEAGSPAAWAAHWLATSAWVPDAAPESPGVLGAIRGDAGLEEAAGVDVLGPGPVADDPPQPAAARQVATASAMTAAEPGIRRPRMFEFMILAFGSDWAGRRYDASASAGSGPGASAGASELISRHAAIAPAAASPAPASSA